MSITLSRRILVLLLLVEACSGFVLGLMVGYGTWHP